MWADVNDGVGEKMRRWCQKVMVGRWVVLGGQQFYITPHLAIRSAWLLYLQRHAKLFKLNSSHSFSDSPFFNTSALPLTSALVEKAITRSS